MDTKKFQNSFYSRTSMPTFRRRLLHGRTANFNSLEKRVLVQLVDPYKDIIDSKKNDATTVKEKENIWIHMTRLFNSKFPGQKPRESKNLQRLWKNIKSRAKAQNTEIDTMLDAEPVGLHLQQPIKLENQSDGVDAEFDEGSRSALADHSFSTESCGVKFETTSEASESCPSSVVSANNQENNGCHRYLQSEVNESGQSGSTAKEISSNLVSHGARNSAAARALVDMNGSVKKNDYERNSFESLETSEGVVFDNDGIRSEYEDNILLMKQSEHEQRMKNLKLEREMKQEEHVLRMDVLKEEMELVRLRKEVLKRQLESYINVINA